MIQACGKREAEILQRMQARGFCPAVICEIGMRPGSWSEAIHPLFPSAEYHLFSVATPGCGVPAVALTVPRDFKLHLATLGGEDEGCEEDRSPTAVPRVARALAFHSAGNVGVEEPSRSRANGGSSGLESDLPSADVVRIDCPGIEDRVLASGAEALKNAKLVFLEVRLASQDESPATSLKEVTALLRVRGLSLVELGEARYDARHRLCSVLAIFASEVLPEEMWRAAVEPGAPEAGPSVGRVLELARTLSALTSEYGSQSSSPEMGSTDESSRPTIENADVVVAHVEVNTKHGVGVLLQRLFGRAPNIISLRSQDHYDGWQAFGAWAAVVSYENKSRDAVFSEVLQTFGRSTAKRVLSVPYYPDDVQTAIAVKEIFGVPMCAYIMDDQNIHERGISDSLVGELLAKSALRLAVSPEIRAAYEQKYGLPMAYMPPLAPSHLIPSELQIPPDVGEPAHGVMIGNIWSGRWLDQLRLTVRDSGVSIAWYSQGDFRHHNFSRESLAADSIVPHEPPSDRDLVRILRRSSFAVVPSGTLDEADDRWSLTQFSLPSRLTYLIATSHIPVLVLGSEKSAAARFVKQFGVGLVAGYGRKSFQTAVREITDEATNRAMRKNAFEIAQRFSDAGAAEWLWQSLARGEPVDRRFEDLMPRQALDLAYPLKVAPGVVRPPAQVR